MNRLIASLPCGRRLGMGGASEPNPRAPFPTREGGIGARPSPSRGGVRGEVAVRVTTRGALLGAEGSEAGGAVSRPHQQQEMLPRADAVGLLLEVGR